MSNQPKPANPIAIAYQLVAEGYGIEDLMVKLKISRASAKSFVFARARG